MVCGKFRLETRKGGALRFTSELESYPYSGPGVDGVDDNYPVEKAKEFVKELLELIEKFENAEDVKEREKLFEEMYKLFDLYAPYASA